MTTPAVPVLTLNNGVHLPALGFGVFRSAPEETTAAVEAALAQGYRLIDTAAAYLNEREVGEAIARTIVVPAVNQVELHPFFIQRDLRETHARLGIATQAWSPLGGVNVYMSKDPSTPKNPLTHSVVIALAAKYGKTPAQVVLRWHVQHGFSAIPKSVTPARIGENVDIFDFTLTPDDVAAIDALDTGVRGGPDPETIDTKLYTKTIPD
jgi:diketogulonate reductase-like aldo/keto reductase